jgi:outer membrane protein assembly factor BamE (lipoprotein component of BamABCDE complex)
MQKASYMCDLALATALCLMLVAGCSTSGSKSSGEIRNILKSLPKDATTKQVQEAVGKPQSVQANEQGETWTYVSPGEFPVLVRFVNGKRAQ